VDYPLPSNLISNLYSTNKDDFFQALLTLLGKLCNPQAGEEVKVRIFRYLKEHVKKKD